MTTPHSGTQYSQTVTPTAYHIPRIHWKIINVTTETVEFGFGSGTFWHATEGEEVVFEIHQVHSGEVHGFFTIGNLTLPANDSRIAAEVAFSIWPWFPGFVSHLDWATVDRNATDVASGLYMEGNLTIQTSAHMKCYKYHQGAWGNQNTTLVYDLDTGLLLEGYTEFFFLHDYHLGVRLEKIDWVVTGFSYFIIVFSGTIITVIIILTYFRRRG